MPPPLAPARTDFPSLLASARAGDAMRAFLVGVRLMRGDGVPMDKEAGVYWIRFAADHGSTFAWLRLGMMYGMGDGVPQDAAEAYKWFQLVIMAPPARIPDEFRGDAVKDAEIVKRRLTEAQCAAAEKAARDMTEAMAHKAAAGPPPLLLAPVSAPPVAATP